MQQPTKTWISLLDSEIRHSKASQRQLSQTQKPKVEVNDWQQTLFV